MNETMVTMKDCHAVQRQDGSLDVDVEGDRGEHLSVRIPRTRRTMLADALLHGMREGAEHTGVRRIGHHESAEVQTAWVLWSQNPTLTVKACAEAVGMNANTLRHNFLRFHGEEYQRLLTETNRGNGRVVVDIDPHKKQRERRRAVREREGAQKA